MFAFASFSCGSDGDADEGKVSVVQGPGSKSAEDEQARLDARLPGRLAEARVFHTATRLDDGRVMVTGGKGRVIKGAPSATAEIFDLAVGDWVLAAELPMARENHRAVLLRDGRVLITGGRGSNSYPTSSSIFDAVTGTWFRGTSMSYGRSSHTATVLGDGRVLVTGGRVAVYLDAAEIFDPATDTWSDTGSMSATVGS